MEPRFAWNCSRGLRTLTCAAALILSFFACFSSLEARYCGRSFDVGLAPHSLGERTSGWTEL
jgi:hypothetical protein